ncbi:MAG: DUF4010 domain-containing protein [Candidatus Micrarchaeia archaeon]|jgi:uncharacterized membrane protein (DUF4010 family)
MIIEEFFMRAFIAIAVGALIGVERELTKKQTLLGIRTLAFSSLLGMLFSYLNFSILIPIGFTIVAFYGIVSFLKQKKQVFGLTTLFSLLLSYLLGVIIGLGYIIEGVGLGIITTFLLFIGVQTRTFVKKLKKEELLEALEFGIILFILYPILPESFSFFGININLHIVLQIIILISIISLLMFLVLIFYGEKFLPVVGLIGGMINSFGTIINFIKKKKIDTSSILFAESGKMLSAILLTFLLIGFQKELFLSCILMAIVLWIFAFLKYRRLPYKKFRLPQPFSLKEGIKIGSYTMLAFILSQLVNNLPYGLYITSLLIGMFSTNAIIATTTLGLNAKSITNIQASIMIFLSLLSGLVIDVFLTRKTKVFREILIFTTITILFGCFIFFLSWLGWFI